MSYPGYDKGSESAAPTEPPPYSHIPPYATPPPLLSSGGQLPPPSYGAAPGIPPNPQGYYPPYNGDPNQGPIIYPPQVILVSSTSTNEPDYLGYSIFTLLCCCLPLGIVALVFSIQTRDANHAGNIVQAKQKSQLARNFSHAALGVGIVVMIVWIAIILTVNLSARGS